jgi:hypothetical protein
MHAKPKERLIDDRCKQLQILYREPLLKRRAARIAAKGTSNPGPRCVPCNYSPMISLPNNKTQWRRESYLGLV